LSETSTTTQTAAAPQAAERRYIERRKHPRYPVSGGGAEIRQQGVEASIWARLTDLSLGGCRVATMAVFLRKRRLPQPLPVLTYVDLVLDWKGQRLQAKGQLVLSHPTFGMGIRFIELSPADRQTLESWIAALAASAQLPVGRVSSEDPAPMLDQETAARLGQAVTEFFRSKPVMSLEEFRQMRLL
jgi:hypothetical protein